MRRAPALLAAMGAALGVSLHLDASYISARLGALAYGQTVSAVVLRREPLPLKGGQVMEGVALRHAAIVGYCPVAPGTDLKSGDLALARVHRDRLFLKDDGGFSSRRAALIIALSGFILILGWQIGTHFEQN